MFEAKVDGLTFKRILESLKDICVDIVLECSETGIVMQSMDHSHVALVSMALTEEFFHTFRCDRNIDLGVSVPVFLKALQPVKSDNVFVNISTVETDMDDDVGQEQLHIGIEDANGGDSWDMTIGILDIEKEHLAIPESDYSVVSHIESKAFLDLVKYLNTIAESVSVKASGKKQISFTTRGDNISVTRLLNIPDLVCIETVEQEFAVRYLALFMRASSLNDTAELSVSPGIPLKLSFPLPDVSGRVVGDAGSRLSFYLAPKIDEV